MPLVREEVKKQLNGYLVTKELEDLDSYIVLPSLNDNQGIMGALKLAVDEMAMQKGAGTSEKFHLHRGMQRWNTLHRLDQQS